MAARGRLTPRTRMPMDTTYGQVRYTVPLEGVGYRAVGVSRLRAAQPNASYWRRPTSFAPLGARYTVPSLANGQRSRATPGQRLHFALQVLQVRW